MFNFDPTCEWTQEVTIRPNANNQCEAWAKSKLPEWVVEQKFTVLTKVFDELLFEITDIYKVLTNDHTARSKEDIEYDPNFHRWLAEFQWEQIMVTSDGKKLIVNLSDHQLLHLAYQYFQTEEERISLVYFYQ